MDSRDVLLLNRKRGQRNDKDRVCLILYHRYPSKSQSTLCQRHTRYAINRVCDTDTLSNINTTQGIAMSQEQQSSSTAVEQLYRHHRNEEQWRNRLFRFLFFARSQRHTKEEWKELKNSSLFSVRSDFCRLELLNRSNKIAKGKERYTAVNLWLP
jgi:hypothetical protein